MHASRLAVFLSTLSLRRATPGIHISKNNRFNFYPRSPCGERLATLGAKKYCYRISIHALLAESDGGVLSSCSAKIIFLSTLSLRRATGPPSVILFNGRISIHALLAESDLLQHSADCNCHSISIHALLAESDKRRLW